MGYSNVHYQFDIVSGTLYIAWSLVRRQEYRKIFENDRNGYDSVPVIIFKFT